MTTSNPIAEALERDFEWFREHLPHHRHPAHAGAATIEPTPGGPVSALTEAKTILHDGLARLESLDENAMAAVESIRVNPAGVSIVNTLAQIAHLPDPTGLLAGVDNSLKVMAAYLAQGAQGTAQAAPTGPTVAGQA